MFLSLITRILERHEPSEIIQLVLEAGHANGGAAEEIFAAMRKIAPDLARFVSGISYARKKETPGVQAADLLAYPVFVTERDGTAEYSDIELTIDRPLPRDQIVNYRVSIQPQTLRDIKIGQIAIATGLIVG